MLSFLVFFGCIALMVVFGIVFAIFGALFRRRRWGRGYPGYYDRPRPWFSTLFFGDTWRRRGFYEPRREHFEREHHHEHIQQHHHHPGGGFGGGGGHHGGGGGGHGGHH